MTEYATCLTELDKLENYLKEKGIDYKRIDEKAKVPILLEDPEMKGWGERHQIIVFQDGKRI